MNPAPLDHEPAPPPEASNAAGRESFVFFDRRGKRWPRFRLWMFAVGLLVFIAVILFIQTLILPANFTAPATLEQPLLANRSQQTLEPPPGQDQANKQLWLNYAKKRKESKTGQAVVGTRRHPSSPQRAQTAGNKAAVTVPVARPNEIRLGFYAGWDPDSRDSLKENVNKLTHLCPDWLTFDIEVGKLQSTADAQVIELAQDQGVTLMPLLTNLGADDAWMAEAVESLVNGPAKRQEEFAAHLVETLVAMPAGGVVLDWQQIDPTYRDNMSVFLGKVAAALHRAHLELWICVPPGQDLNMYDLDRLSGFVDHFVAMLHDEHAESDKPGPIASREFFAGWLSTLVGDYGAPGQWIISLGSYGYEWTDSNNPAEPLSFADVMSRAKRSALTSCAFGQRSLNPHFAYQTGQTIHTVWFLDAITFLNQLTLARSRHVGGIAVNRLGTEDPAIWDVLAFNFDKVPPPDQLARLETIKSDDSIAQIGHGNLISIAGERSNGSRRIAVDAKGDPGAMLTAVYDAFPGYLTVLHQGQGADDGVVITFDDGPDAKWTPQILDILKEKKVKATFFMIGGNMEKHPKIVQRIFAEGHMIGLHTYSHPNIAEVSEERAHLEFNATQRLLESITGHSTVLFRPPYNADTNPHEPEELVPIQLAQDMGYLTVTEDIDPEDWDRPGVEAMLERVRHDRMRGGNVVLFHDAGGDRGQTVAALPLVIDYLAARGDRILPLPDLLGIPAAQLMPVVADNQQSLIRIISENGFITIRQLTNFFWAFMVLATGLTVLRTLIISWLAVRSRWDTNKKESNADLEPFCPPISVLIAAYNEEKVIRDTLRSVLNTDYPGAMEVVVVDDGSLDATAAIVAALAADDARIRLIRQVNLGKAVALRHGMRVISHAFVVCLDADTQFTPQTIGHLIRPFVDPAVGAVSGRAKVGNPKTLVARFQSLEYTCGFNLDRRAYHRLNCITVVPGAVSAFRVSAMQAAGGISTETLAEDTDLTLALHKCGAVVRYAPRAIAWTEAPETIRAFAKQRFRWAFGTLQCLWKHRDLLFNPHYPALGWFSLPSAWFFNIFLVGLGSIIDLILLCSLAMSPANSMLYLYFLVFLAADLVLAAVACLVEREPLAQTWLVLPMRFVYRPVLNIVVIRAILRALKGVWVGWGKLDRTASVPYKV